LIISLIHPWIYFNIGS